jgi:hypothetical protein
MDEEMGNISLIHGKGFHFPALDPATFHTVWLSILLSVIEYVRVKWCIGRDEDDLVRFQEYPVLKENKCPGDLIPVKPPVREGQSLVFPLLHPPVTATVYI